MGEAPKFQIQDKTTGVFGRQKGGSSVRRDGIGNEAVIWNKQSRKIICNEVKA